MNEPAVDEFGALNEALRNVIEQTSESKDPIMAGGVCVLYKSNEIEMLSVEASGSEFGTLHALSIALLEALVKQETDQRVRRPLQQALQLATHAQQLRFISPTGKMH